MQNTILIVFVALLVGAILGYFLGRRRPSQQPSPRSPFGIGLLAGGAFAVLAGAIFWMSRPGPEEAPAVADTPVVAPATEPHQTAGALSPALAARDQYLVENPDDLDARREMALLLVAEERHMDALGQADRILERSPGDPTALYVQGVVRLTMGQRDSGKGLLEQALASDPRHIHSLIALGTVHLQDGDGENAVAVLERALEAAGGRHEGIQAKLSQARAMSGGS